MIDNYADIIGRAHHVSKVHPPMPMESRAAQFAPFAALTGYEDAIAETGRQTDRRIELSDEDKRRLDETMAKLRDSVGEHPLIRVSYFQPDERKDGGRYQTIEGALRSIDEVQGDLLMTDGQKVALERIDDIILLG